MGTFSANPMQRRMMGRAWGEVGASSWKASLKMTRTWQYSKPFHICQQSSDAIPRQASKGRPSKSPIRQDTCHWKGREGGNCREASRRARAAGEPLWWRKAWRRRARSFASPNTTRSRRHAAPPSPAAPLSESPPRIFPRQSRGDGAPPELLLRLSIRSELLGEAADVVEDELQAPRLPQVPGLPIGSLDRALLTLLGVLEPSWRP